MNGLTALELQVRREATLTVKARLPELQELVTDLLNSLGVDEEVSVATNYHGLIKQLKPLIKIMWNRWQRDEPIYDKDGDQLTDDNVSELIAELRHIIACYEEYM